MLYSYGDIIHTKLNSSDNIIQTLFIKKSPLGLSILINEGDLDGDGGDEISFLREHMTSSWHCLHLYTIKNDEWKNIYSATVITTEMTRYDYDEVYKKGINTGEIISIEYEDWGIMSKKIIKEINNKYIVTELTKLRKKR
ncbi:MAG: hypothetical protein IPL35_14330 [Sphingobacteriales bacterium]|nr:hypothetical protein [Sphingobacteriales bacterium]